MRFGLLVLVPVVALLALGQGVSPSTEMAEWRRCSAAGFSEAAQAMLAGGPTKDEWSDLEQALEGDAAEAATRAATILGAVAGDPKRQAVERERAMDTLAALLGARRTAGSRGAEGAAIVAAKALSVDEREATRDLLVELAAGAAPHPDLATRVECAAAIVQVRTGEVTPFLLAVLRAETPDQVKSPRTWERVTTLAWVKTRAALALSEATGLPLRFRPDGSWAHQMSEADRLEEALR